MPEVPPLPEPDSEELEALPVSAEARAVYRLLFTNRARPMSMLEIRHALTGELGEQEQLDRRKRELNKYFVLEKSWSGQTVKYRLASRKAVVESDVLGISERDRAEVLRLGRCVMCGRTPELHGVVLQVDHKMPQSWGGTHAITNLQPLCEECNRGKKAYFASLDAFGPEIRAASEYDEPHKRIGELLKRVAPAEVRSDIVELVAHSKQYQSEWRKRLRELRVLGWRITTRKEKEAGRVHVYWRVEHWEPWPPGNIAAEVRRLEGVSKAQDSPHPADGRDD